MGITSELHAEIFVEPSSDSEYVQWLEQEHQRMEREREAYFWEVDCAPCPIDAKDKELLVKEKCARAAHRLRSKQDRESL